MNFFRNKNPVVVISFGGEGEEIKNTVGRGIISSSKVSSLPEADFFFHG